MFGLGWLPKCCRFQLEIVKWGRYLATDSTFVKIWLFTFLKYLLEIFHITPTRTTIVQKSTKYVKYARCFPMGNLSFICGRHELTNRTIK